MLLITFSSTTFAWFVYATKITTGITAHIEAWNILFTSQDNLISEYVYFTIPDMYPGMADYDDGVCRWPVQAEHIFTSGIAYIQIKSVNEGGEVWHSPKATVEFEDSLDSRDTQNFTPSLYQQLDARVNEIYELANTFGETIRDYTEEIIISLADSDYITRQEAISLINEAIDDLMLPLSRRLDGE